MKSEVDDWISDLPPLDGAEDDPAAEEGSHDDLLPDAQEEASLDDSAADDLDVDDGVDIADDEPSGGEDDERWEADVGEPELDLADDASVDAGDADAPGVNEGDLDLDEDLPSSTDDAGEEGTTDAIEQSIDEELPALDADDEGDFEDALLLETGLMAPTVEGPRWASGPWERLPSADRAFSQAVPDDDAVVGVALCVAPEVLVSVTAAGRLLVDGDSVESRGGRLLPTALASRKGGPPLIALFARDGTAVLWAANRTGQLAHSVDGGRSWSTPIDVGKSIIALGIGADGSIAVLATHDGQAEVVRSVDGSLWTTQAVQVDGHPLQLSTASSAWLAVGTSSLALGDATGVWLSREGEEFRRVATVNGPALGSFVGRDPQAPLVFAEAGADNDEATRFFRVTGDGRVEILAELTPPDEERAESPSVLALAWDEMSHALRVAFSSVICTLAPARTQTVARV